MTQVFHLSNAHTALYPNYFVFWLQIGVWQSYQPDNNGLDIKDIVWPGQSHVPPQGVPEKFHLTVGFLEEPPFVNLAPPDPVTGKCNVDRGVPCRMSSSSGLATSEVDQEQPQSASEKTA